MSAQGFRLFDTGIGRCGVAWGGRGIVGVQLPEARDTDTHARLLRRFPGAREATPPPAEGAATNPQKALFDGDGRLDFDPKAAVGHLRAVEPALGRLVDTVGPFALERKRMPSLFGALAEAIVYQQLTGRAAATIYGRLCALFPRAHEGPTAAHVLRVSDGRLRGAGLSRAKVLALRDLAKRAAAGEVPSLTDARRMDDAALVEGLTRVRGIGRWTVEMLLIFRLGRPDVLPADDYGVRKGFATVFRKRELPAPRDVAQRGARWAPYRTVAAWYLWRAAERADR